MRYRQTAEEADTRVFRVLEDVLKISPLIMTASALALVLTVFASCYAPAAGQQPEEGPGDATALRSSTSSAMPAEDVAGAEVPGLPRYPGSVRVAYEQGEEDGLVVTDAAYVADAELDAIRGFYRDVFRSEGWSVADKSYSEEEWAFLVTDDEHEARVVLSAPDAERDAGRDAERDAEFVEVKIESSEPPPGEEGAPADP